MAVAAGGNAGMWCPRCHTEVAAEIAQNGQSLNCTSCGTEIQRIYAPSLHPDTRSARELLDRWSKSDLLDGATESAPAASEPALPTAAVAAPLPPTANPQETAPVQAPLVHPVVPTTVAAAAPPEAPVGNDLVENSSAPMVPSDPLSGRRERPERLRPDRPAPKPRTTWRVDAAHNVTQPVPPLPPPTPPRRPYFSASVADAESVTAEPQPAPPSPAPGQERHSETAAQLRDTSDRRESSPRQDSTDRDSSDVDSEHRVRRERKNVAASKHLTEADDDEEVPVRQRRSPASFAETAVASSSPQYRLDSPHESPAAPHFDLQSFLAQDTRKPGRSESIWGQVLAYLGVGLITVGTTIVLWAWFKQTPGYAPTGWLICTVGQMLLFLGVITLVSGGIQQTSHEVTRRVEYLGHRILRFEQSAEQAMRAPHFDEMQDRKRSRSKAAQRREDDELDS